MSSSARIQALPINAPATLGAAWRAAWKYTPRKLASWREDIACDVVLHVVEANLAGVKLSQRMFALLAIQAVRRLMVDGGRARRWEREFVPLDEAHLVEQPNELAPIALWRLQKTWAHLTDHQRLGLYQLVSGRGLKEIAAEHGVNWRVLSAAKGTAVKHIDEGFVRHRRCSTEDCEALATGRGLCPRCYWRWYVSDVERRAEVRRRNREAVRRHHMKRRAARLKEAL